MSGVAFAFPTDEGLLLRGDADAPVSSKAPVVICVHGFKGFKDWGFWPEVARRLSESGYGVIRFNFSHSGIGEDLESFTEARLFETGTYTREVKDLREVLSHLVKRRLPGTEKFDPSRVGLLAHSRGSVAALAVAASGNWPVRSVVLWNPVASILWWDEETRRLWRERGFWEVVNARTGQVFRMTTALLEDAEQNRERLDPVANARRLLVPLLAVVASQDEAVPAESGRQLVRVAARAPASLRELASTGHTFGAVHPFGGMTPALEEAIQATVVQWEETLKKEDA